MQKILTLSNEQSLTLYNLLSTYEVSNRSDNRKRFKFLEVIEESVLEYEDKIKEFVGKKTKEVESQVNELSKLSKKFTFPDREIFAQVKDMFEKCFETGNKSKNAMGKVESSPLVGRAAKVYMEIENAFMEVKELKE